MNSSKSLVLSRKRKWSPFASMSSEVMVDVSFKFHVRTLSMNVMVRDIKTLFFLHPKDGCNSIIGLFFVVCFS